MSLHSKSNYDKHPMVKVSSSRGGCEVGWSSIAQRLKSEVTRGRFIVCVECYPGCFETEIERELGAALNPSMVIRAAECYQSENAILSACDQDLGDDPVFAFMNHHAVSD